MAISFQRGGRSTASAARLFPIVTDVRTWTDFPGVRVTSPDRPLVTGDEVEVAITAVGGLLRVELAVDGKEEPASGRAGWMSMKTVRGPFDGSLLGTATDVDGGCELTMLVKGRGLGPVRLLEPPLGSLMRRWIDHELATAISLGEADGHR